MIDFPICVCGGWAVYYTIIDIFKKKKNREYIGSQDIDIGFSLKPMLTKNELESTNLFKTIEILESNGYKPARSVKFPMKILNCYGDTIVY